MFYGVKLLEQVLSVTSLDISITAIDPDLPVASVFPQNLEFSLRFLRGLSQAKTLLTHHAELRDDQFNSDKFFKSKSSWNNLF